MSLGTLDSRRPIPLPSDGHQGYLNVICSSLLYADNFTGTASTGGELLHKLLDPNEDKLEVIQNEDGIFSRLPLGFFTVFQTDLTNSWRRWRSSPCYQELEITTPQDSSSLASLIPKETFVLTEETVLVLLNGTTFMAGKFSLHGDITPYRMGNRRGILQIRAIISQDQSSGRYFYYTQNDDGWFRCDEKFVTATKFQLIPWLNERLLVLVLRWQETQSVLGKRDGATSTHDGSDEPPLRLARLEGEELTNYIPPQQSKTYWNNIKA